MSSETLLLIILAGIIALLLALFQYIRGEESVSRLHVLLSALRFITLFSVLLLLINPKFESTILTSKKPNLVLLVDNSSSIKHLKQEEIALNVIEKITQSEVLNDKFNISSYTFGAQIKASDTLSFSETQTNLSDAFNQLSQIYKNSNTATILISDGNQTFGSDYEFATTNYKSPIYPVVLGDTVKYTDLKIKQLHANRYAYLKNRFPVEAIITYNGNANVNSRFVVTQGETTWYSQRVTFTKQNNSKTLHFTLLAKRVGVSRLKATIIPIENEKNTVNNSKHFAVEVIDQKTKIAIVSDFLHPDLGAFKKSIESNEQRSVFFLSPNDAISQIKDFQLLIIYQPNHKFNKLFDVIKKESINNLLIVGTKTDLNFLNRTKQSFTHEITNAIEYYSAELNPNYAPFIINDIDFESFPPLKSNFGDIKFSVPFDVILQKKRGNLTTNQPLLASYEENNRREAVLFGENIWQWRAQSFVNTTSFNDFDDFIGKLVQYLASSKPRDRLNLEYQSFYDGNSSVVLNAQFFDKNYVFDSRASLNLLVKDEASNFEQNFPFVLKNNNYQVELSRLPPSEYRFIVKVENEGISKSGSFEILEFNVEQQFLNANSDKLNQLAQNSGGVPYFPNQTDSLIEHLKNDNHYQAIQESNKNIVPLLAWNYLLLLIAISLTSEWFLRKYNGLI
ncbi:VWA domain-containing protein [Oceanihabitans sp. IOP_32]|uniref:VWA domain-containing protein n=1 Tax=Oceanihabitans sp. IOP_32 TaxID=2529032 RepID=UPI001293B684|nr:VWA domain-containing protein [Oceanihabitans sp. IOP_32]QFZ55818.1 VWA domain-containing protein [Oceanihabitans sp. IOP_32]